VNVSSLCFSLLPPLPPPAPSPLPPYSLSMLDDNDFIVALNLNQDLDFFTMYNREHRDPEIDDDPYFGINVSSKYYDIHSLSSSIHVKKSPVYISINIQSLQSKYEQFLQEINELEQKGIEIEVIALQEIWDMKYPELFPLPGYKPLICKTRVGMRGGGVGFYIKNHINYQLLKGAQV
jgi:hypothetical protein